jgi:glutamine synthetase
MSQTFRWYLGGLIATAREFSLLFAPTINSYRRFLPGSWAPTAVAWSVDNRTLGFRIVGHGQGMRVESRIPGADANTYHAFAATIAGGMYGVNNRIDPPAPYDGNGYTAGDLPRIPGTFVEAMELWRNSTIARECFGDDVHHHVLNFAETEWLAFNQTVTDWERKRYFERI